MDIEGLKGGQTLIAGIKVVSQSKIATSAQLQAPAKSSTGDLLDLGNNKDLSGEGQVDKFTSLIKDAVKKGFEDAGTILKGLGPVDEGIQGNMDHTLELALKGIEDFADQQKKLLAEQQADQEQAASQLAGTAKKGDLVGVI